MNARTMTLAAGLAVATLLAVGIWNRVTLVSLLGRDCCDGIVSISQARARAGGITPSDAPGFPVTLDVGGSYRLTSDLIIVGADETAIELIKAEDLVRGVTLDLNGFRIEGPGQPPNGIRSSLACTATGEGDGVIGPNFGGGQGTAYLTIRNGSIIGMGDEAVSCSRCRVEGIMATANGGGGITATEGAVTGSTVIRNCGHGIRTELAEENVVLFNRDNGIQGSLVRDNVVEDNGGIGIQLSGGVAIGNTIGGNEGAALRVLSGGFGLNHIAGAVTLDPISQQAVQIGTNWCNGNTVCP